MEPGIDEMQILHTLCTQCAGSSGLRKTVLPRHPINRQPAERPARPFVAQMGRAGLAGTAQFFAKPEGFLAFKGVPASPTLIYEGGLGLQSMTGLSSNS